MRRIVTPRRLFVAAFLVVTALASTHYQFEVRYHSDFTGFEWSQHQLLMQGQGGNPVQFRMFSDLLWEWLERLQQWRGSGDPIYTSILFLRYAQSLVFFPLAYLYYRRVGLSWRTSLLGIAVLTLGLVFAYRVTTTRTGTYFDAMFYFAAAIAILARRDWWVAALAPLASLNRETSGFLPLMLLVARLPELRSGERRTKTLAIAGVASATWLAVYVAQRLVFPDQGLVTDVGWTAIDLNFFRETTWSNLFGTLGMVPFVALAGYLTWPRILQWWFWLIVPAWVVIHAFYSLMNESALFTVPFALILIPGALFGAVHGVREPEQAATRVRPAE